jgi:hypothetical protein
LHHDEGEGICLRGRSPVIPGIMNHALDRQRGGGGEGRTTFEPMGREELPCREHRSSG